MESCEGKIIWCMIPSYSACFVVLRPKHLQVRQGRFKQLDPLTPIAFPLIASSGVTGYTWLRLRYLCCWGYTWVPWFFMLSGFILCAAEMKSPRQAERFVGNGAMAQRD